jgi:hypothetical protein
LKSFEYVGNGKVCVSVKAQTGELVRFSMPTAAFLRPINAAVQCVNDHLNSVLADTLGGLGADVGGAVH